MVSYKTARLSFIAWSCLLLALLWTTAPAQVPSPWVDTKPLPVDTGSTGLKVMLRRLHTTARLMHTVAHPDDEDGGMLTLESRGHGVSVLQLTLNRGEGGQNKVGSNLFDELGIVRTLELLAADRYYGVEQRFTRVADFGFSKTPEETFQKWGGHDIALGDMVRVIRTFRPDVICTRFQGNSRDGHGHHQASGILTREAFRAAADPTRFPEQIREGLQPWQAKKLYMDNVRANEDWTVQLETSQFDPLLGETYVQFAWKGLKHQLSQGAGAWTLPEGTSHQLLQADRLGHAEASRGRCAREQTSSTESIPRCRAWRRGLAPTKRRCRGCVRSSRRLQRTWTKRPRQSKRMTRRRRHLCWTGLELTRALIGKVESSDRCRQSRRPICSPTCAPSRSSSSRPRTWRSARTGRRAGHARRPPHGGDLLHRRWRCAGRGHHRRQAFPADGEVSQRQHRCRWT